MKLVSLIILCFLIPMVSSSLNVGTGSDTDVFVQTKAKKPLTNFTIKTVNVSEFWQGTSIFDDETDIPQFPLWYNHSLNVPTNSTLVDYTNVSRFNESIAQLTASKTYLPFNFTIEAGIFIDGNLSSIQISKDVNTNNGTINVSEATGSNPLIIIINFTNVNDFNTILLREKYEGGLGHEIIIGLWDTGTNSYEEEYGEITDMNDFAFSSIPVSDSSDHIISGGNVSIRFRHVQNGNTGHTFKLDYVVLIEGFSTVTTSEHDALTGRDDVENHPLYVAKDGQRNFTESISFAKNINLSGSLFIDGFNISIWLYNQTIAANGFSYNFSTLTNENKVFNTINISQMIIKHTGNMFFLEDIDDFYTWSFGTGLNEAGDFGYQVFPSASAYDPTFPVRIYSTQDGKIGINTKKPSLFGLNVNGSANITGNLIVQGFNFSEYLYNQTIGSSSFSYNFSTLTNENKVFNTLNVSGNVIFNSNLQVDKNFSVNGETLFVDSSNNRVGIGMAPTQATLEIEGNVLITRDSSAGTFYQIENREEGGEIWKIVSTGSASSIGVGKLAFQPGVGAFIMVFNGTTGNVGIGNNTPTNRLSVGGDVRTSDDLFVGGLLQVTGQGSPPSGTGMELEWDGTQGDILAYDRDLGAWKPMRIRGSKIVLHEAGTDVLTIDNLKVSTSGALGIGVVPTDQLSIQLDQNAITRAKILNENAGASAQARFQASTNGGASATFVSYGTAFVLPALRDSAAMWADTDASGGLFLGSLTANTDVQILAGGVSNQRIVAKGTGGMEFRNGATVTGKMSSTGILNITSDIIGQDDLFIFDSVGIGTMSPAYTLDVIGDIGVSKNLTVNGGNINISSIPTASMTVTQVYLCWDEFKQKMIKNETGCGA